MSIFAIGDLHLPGHEQKPMDIFGNHWDRHFDTIKKNWWQNVQPEDVVLIPGDISWAMKLEDVLDDLYSIAALPGKKVILKGNHDYWWSSPSQIRSILPDDMYLIQNDALAFQDYVICGTRGWIFPTEAQPLSVQDQKIYERELIRLQISLDAAKKIKGKEIIVMLHFPPLLHDGKSTGFTHLLEANHIQTVVYGHLHGQGIRNAYCGFKNDVRYQLVSCDSLQFSPLLLPL